MDPEGPIPLEEIRRRRRTEALRSTLPYSARWETWLESSGETVPDFEVLVPRPHVWSPVEGLRGAGQWPARALAIHARLAHWVLGSAPPAPAEPDLDVDVMAERAQGGTIDRLLEVAVEGHEARVRARLLMPAGASGLPVVLTTSAHAWWAAAALRRGWAICLADAGGAWLAGRAWSLARGVDALTAMDEIDPERIVVAAHGPDARIALAATARDPRIAAVAASSSGVLGAIPARLCAERHHGPGIEGVTRLHAGSFHPRLRFFAGREHLLPTDAHELLALLAPRPALITVATGDRAESTWAAEQAVDAARPVWELLGAPAGTLGLRWREGAGECTLEAWESILDWADHVVGRTGTSTAPTGRLHLRGGVSWPRTVAPRRALLATGALRAAIATALGPEPPAAGDVAVAALPEPDHVTALLRTRNPGSRRTVRTTDGVPVDVFLPAAGAGRLLLWLGPLARASGYGEPFVADGWAVACFDAIGTGARLHEEGAFRRRHPDWSLLGRMVRDARAALAAAATVPGVDAAAPYLAGHGAGAVCALHVAVLDPSVEGVAALAPAAGEVPLLAAEPAHGLADLLGGLGSRRALVISPATDAEADPGDVADSVAAAAAEGIDVAHVEVEARNHLGPEMRAHLALWLSSAARAGRAA